MLLTLSWKISEKAFGFLLLAKFFHCLRQPVVFDHFTLALQWLPAVCEHYRINGIQRPCYVNETVKTWVTHGLWPSRKASGKPTYCNQDWQFDYNEIHDRLGYKLLQYWPDPESLGRNKSYWEDQFKRHGTCSLKVQAVRGVFNYFKKALSLNRKIDTESLLRSYRIHPANDRAYPPYAVLDAFRIKTGKKVLLGCARSDNGKTYFLGQIELCVDKTLKKIIDCPSTYINTGLDYKNSNFKNCPTYTDLVYLPLVYSKHYTGNAGMVSSTALHNIIQFVMVRAIFLWRNSR